MRLNNYSCDISFKSFQKIEKEKKYIKRKKIEKEKKWKKKRRITIHIRSGKKKKKKRRKETRNSCKVVD